MTHSITRAPDPEVPSHERVTMTSSAGIALAVDPQAGMVTTSLLFGGVEVLGRRGGLPKYLTDQTTFGVPLLAPWANRLASATQQVGAVNWSVQPGSPGVHPDAFGQPLHGLLGGIDAWQIEDSGADNDHAWIRSRLRFDESLDRFPGFPFAHDLEVEVELRGHTARYTTSLTATGNRSVPVAFGWHPYVAFPEIPREQWQIDVPFIRHATANDASIPTGDVTDRPIESGDLGNRIYDDLFVDLPDNLVARVSAGDRSVEFRFVRGYPFGVMWAPSHLDVVCIEPMTAPTDPFSGKWPVRVAEPGQTVDAVFELTVSRI
ncbi:MAG: aldose 1-epimerase [Actinomycetes bacterium]